MFKNKTKKLVVFFCVVFVLFAAGNVFLQAEERKGKWQKMRSNHFFVYFLKSDKEFARETLSLSQTYYRKISSVIGLRKYGDSKKEKPRINIYLYSDHQAFIEGTGQPQWAGGYADYNNRTIASYISSKTFFDVLLPHEITHIVFRDFVGFKSDIPAWIDEGVAQWQEKGKKELAREKIKEMLKQKKVYSLKELTQLNVYKLSTEDEVRAYYLQAVSVIDFLIEKYGSIRFIDLCLEMRDGVSFEAGLDKLYPLSASTVEKLDKRWRKYITDGY